MIVIDENRRRELKFESESRDFSDRSRRILGQRLRLHQHFRRANLYEVCDGRMIRKSDLEQWGRE